MALQTKRQEVEDNNVKQKREVETEAKEEQKKKSKLVLALSGVKIDRTTDAERMEKTIQKVK